MNASTVLMSGFGAPRFTATPMPDDMMSARLSARSLPDLIRSLIWKSTSTARSNGSPRLDPPFHHLRHVGGHHRLEAGRLLELRTEFAEDHLGDARAEHFQLGGLRGRADREQHNAASTPCSFLMLIHPAIANFAPKISARITTAGFASVIFPAMSLQST